MRQVNRSWIVRSAKRQVATRGVFAGKRSAGYGALIMLVWGLMALAAAPAVHADPPSGGSLAITIPAPVNGTAEGPVGANVTVVGAGFTPNDSYQLGFSPSGSTCAAVFNGFSISPQQAAADGTLRQTLIWPQDADAVGGSYYICARDVTNSSNPVVESSQVYQVDAASAPSIHAKVAPQPTPGPGTPAASPTTQPSGVFYVGQQVTVTGQNFMPGGQELTVYVTSGKISNIADLQAGSPLVIAGGSSTTFTADQSGAFSVTVTVTQLPASSLPNTFYLYVVSGDATATAPPSLAGYQKFKMEQAPAAPTPTVVPTDTPSSQSAPPPAAPKPGGSNNMVAAIILGVLSVVLFIAGVALLASAAASPAAPRR